MADISELPWDQEARAMDIGQGLGGIPQVKIIADQLRSPPALHSSSPARHSARLAILLLMTVATTTSCSFLLDLEPDCESVSDCTPYRCNGENTACRSSCTSDAECALGYLCERGSNSCIAQGCTPIAESVRLFSIEGTSLEYEAGYSAGSFWVLYSSTQGVGLAQVTPEGALVGGEGNLTVLDEDPAATVHPMVVGSQEGVHLFWLGSLADLRPVIHHYGVTPAGVTFGPNNVYEAWFDQNIDLPSACLIGDQIALAWTTLVQRSQIQLLVLNSDGTYGSASQVTAPNEAAFVVSEEDTGSSQPALAATTSRGGFAHRETQAGLSTIDVSFFNSEFETISSHQVSNDYVSSVEDLDAAGMEGAIAVAWTEVRGGQRVIMRAVDAESGPLRMAWNSNDFTTTPKDISVSAAADEFALVWVADADGMRDVFLARYSQNGELLFVTFAVTGHSAIDPSKPLAVPTEDGYAVFWIENGVEPSDLYFQRFTCTR